MGKARTSNDADAQAHAAADAVAERRAHLAPVVRLELGQAPHEALPVVVPHLWRSRGGIACEVSTSASWRARKMSSAQAISGGFELHKQSALGALWRRFWVDI